MSKIKPARKKLDSPFSKNLKDLMQSRGLTAKAVAELAEVSPSVVQDWLAGSVPHNLKSIAKLANSVNSDFQFLLTGTHGKVNVKELSLSELFETEPDPSFSGVFLLEAKRLKKRV